MNGITLQMAIMDFIPVLLYLFSMIILQMHYSDEMSHTRFALLSAGTAMVFFGGLYKALWKALYALNICDFVTLENSLFPLQAPGFILVFLSFLGFKEQPASKYFALVAPVAPAVYSSNLIFIIMQTLGCGGTQLLLSIRSFKNKRGFAGVMFILSFITMLGMGYLSAKFDSSSTMNWIAQCTNTASQLFLLIGSICLCIRKKGE